MDETPVKILFVEDLPSDIELVERELHKDGLLYDSRRVDTRDAFLGELRAFHPDIVISDYSMPAFDGMTALTIAREKDPFLPFIILTGSMNEDTAVSCMKAGASDYVIKEHMSRLAYAVREAIERRKMLQKAAEQEELIRQSEERYRSLFMNSNVAMLILDPESATVRDANDAAIAFYGWPREEFIDKPLSEINTLGPKEIQEMIRAAMTRERSHFQFKHRRAGGITTDVETHSGPLELEGRTHLLSVVHDISERVAAEGERDALAFKLGHYLSTSPTVTYSLRLQNGAAHSDWISENIERMLGYTPDEALRPDWWFNNVFAADRSTAIKGITELVGNESYVQEYRFVKKDRSVVWLRDEMRLVKSKGGAPEIVGTLTDITERKRAEEEIDLKSAALEAADNAVIITDRDGKIEWMNSAFERLTGYTRAEAIGKNPRDLLKSGKHEGAFYKALWDTILSGSVWRGELINRRKSGERYSEEMTITPVLDSSRRIEHFIAVKSDVTERTLSKRRLEASLREKDVLLREVHHRVKNNMQVISSLLHLSIENDPVSPYRRTIDEVTRRIESMATVHEHFYESQDLTRIDFSLYLKQLATSLLEECDGQIRRPDFVYTADEVLLSLEQAIPAGLIISEFISNALRYAFQNEARPASLQIVLGKRPGDALAVEVRDNGVGLPPGFDPRTARSLGMKLVGILSEQLNGTVSYHVNEGTAAILCFPLKAAR